MAHSIDIPNVEHTAPIPMGSRVGNMIFSSGIMGADPKTGVIPDDAAQQAEFAFQNLRTFLELAGAKPEHVGKVTVHVKNEADRDLINKPWLEMFPDPHHRPARHAVQANLRRNMLFQLEVIAVLP